MASVSSTQNFPKDQHLLLVLALRHIATCSGLALDDPPPYARGLPASLRQAVVVKREEFAQRTQVQTPDD